MALHDGFSWDKKDSESLLHSADPSSAAGKVIDLCDMDLSSENEGLLILGEKGLNYCRKHAIWFHSVSSSRILILTIQEVCSNLLNLSTHHQTSYGLCTNLAMKRSLHS